MTELPVSIEGRFTRQLMDLSPEERLAMACRMFSAAKALVRAGIPNAGSLSSSDVRVLLFLRLYSEDFDQARRAQIVAWLTAT